MKEKSVGKNSIDEKWVKFLLFSLDLNILCTHHIMLMENMFETITKFVIFVVVVVHVLLFDIWILNNMNVFDKLRNSIN